MKRHATVMAPLCRNNNLTLIQASEFVDDCLSAIRGLDVDSPLFRSKIQLKQCTIQVRSAEPEGPTC